MVPFFLVFITHSISIINAYNNGVGKLPFMGWNTWCTDDTCGYDVCNEQEIKEIASAMLSNGMYDVGYRYINMDDCWMACNRTSNGSLYGEPTRFPNGMANMISYVHNLTTPNPGDTLKFGIYTDVGTHTCSGGHRDNCSPPGCYGHYQQDADTLAAWKVDMVKFDGCAKPSNESWQSLHTQFSKALNNTGRPILLELDGGYPLPAPPYPPSISQAWKIVPDHHDNWDSTKSTIGLIANQTQMSGPYGWAYADFLMTGGQGCSGGYNNEQYLHCPGQTDVEYMTEFAMFAIGGSPLLVATDIRNMTDIMKKVLLNTEIIAVNQQDATPAGKFVYVHDCNSNTKDVCQVWSRKLNESNTAAVVLLNIDDEQHGITVEFDQLGMGWNSNTKVSVRDLWEHKDIGEFTGSYSTEVVPHGNFFGKLTLAS